MGLLPRTVTRNNKSPFRLHHMSFIPVHRYQAAEWMVRAADELRLEREGHLSG